MPKTFVDAGPDFADLLILDDMIPCGFSPFRTLEYGHYLSFFNAKLLSLEGWHLWLSNEDFSAAVTKLAMNSEVKDRIVQFGAGLDAVARLAYVTFLGNAGKLMPFLEARQLPFIFQLYPGGGFKINEADSDKTLQHVVLSPLCRKVIVTQRLTHDYIIDRVRLRPWQGRVYFWWSIR